MTHQTLKKGYSLVEVLVAISILMLAIVAPMTIAVKSIKSAQYVHQQNTAVFLAQEGVTIINTIRDNNGLRFFNGTITDPWEWPALEALEDCFESNNEYGCNVDMSDPDALEDSSSYIACNSSGENCRLYFDESEGRSVFHVDGSSGNESPYIRRIVLVDNGDEIQVVSTVEWDSNLLNEEQTVSVTGSFYNIYKDYGTN